MSKKIRDEALKLIKSEIDKKNFKDISYLNYLTTYLISSKDEIKPYIKPIKKSIKSLEKSFDHIYLLLFVEENNQKVFYEDLNWSFLDYCDELAFILSQNDMSNEVDKITQLKGKIELGYNRYLEQDKIKVKSFIPKLNQFEIYSNSETSFFIILKDLLELKYSKNKKFKSELKKIEKYFEYFPQEIFTKKSIHLLEIEKSLFQNEIETKKIKDITLANFNSPQIANLVLKLL